MTSCQITPGNSVASSTGAVPSSPASVLENVSLIILNEEKDPIFDGGKPFIINISKVVSPDVIFRTLPTDCDGRCEFIDVPKGEYIVSIDDKTWEVASACYILNGQKYDKDKSDMRVPSSKDGENEHTYYLRKKQ